MSLFRDIVPNRFPETYTGFLAGKLDYCTQQAVGHPRDGEDEAAWPANMSTAYVDLRKQIYSTVFRATIHLELHGQELEELWPEVIQELIS